MICTKTAETSIMSFLLCLTFCNRNIWHRLWSEVKRLRVMKSSQGKGFSANVYRIRSSWGPDEAIIIMNINTSISTVSNTTQFPQVLKWSYDQVSFQKISRLRELETERQNDKETEASILGFGALRVATPRFCDGVAGSQWNIITCYMYRNMRWKQSLQCGDF